MKTMTCRQLGGACDKKLTAETFEQIAEMSKAHGMEMFQKGDKPHLQAMENMKKLIGKPEDMQAWFDAKRAEFDSLSED